MKHVKSSLWKSLVGVGIVMAGITLASADQTEGTTTKAKPYPLKTCIVSGEKLGGMGAPYVFTNENREIKLCCKGCLKDFNKEPAKYIKKLDESAKAQSTSASSPSTGHDGHQH